jgi:hypothetical protein
MVLQELISMRRLTQKNVSGFAPEHTEDISFGLLKVTGS